MLGSLTGNANHDDDAWTIPVAWSFPPGPATTLLTLHRICHKRHVFYKSRMPLITVYASAYPHDPT